MYVLACVFDTVTKMSKIYGRSCLSVRYSNQEVQKEMSAWGLTFAQSLLKLIGRVLEPEKIYQHDTNVSNLALLCPVFNIFVVL